MVGLINYPYVPFGTNYLAGGSKTTPFNVDSWNGNNGYKPLYIKQKRACRSVSHAVVLKSGLLAKSVFIFLFML